ncbi:unnamed protein product [Paramecium sonneborni]|uniref:Uncharacterized protein n=1 Tax=Paramecium sonneborni TaxID=65129 RepID=A0A8S1NH00_9CILI|nr:unnamed protein product [Paramecium sonneborni]
MSYYPGYNQYNAPLGQSLTYPNTYGQPVSYAPVQYATPIQYAAAQPITQSVVQSVAVQPIVQQSYITQPVAVQQVVAQPVQQTIRGESRVEYKEYQKQVVEMETETIQVQVPKTKYVTDYYPVEYQTEYIPRTVYEQQTEYVPITKTVPRVEYEAVEREVQRQQQVVVQQPVVQQYIAQPAQYIQQPVVQTVIQKPVIQSVVQQPLTYSTIRPAQPYIPSVYQAPVASYPQSNKDNKPI